VDGFTDAIIVQFDGVVGWESDAFHLQRLMFVERNVGGVNLPYIGILIVSHMTRQKKTGRVSYENCHICSSRIKGSMITVS
jgi:hypothetical protein